MRYTSGQLSEARYYLNDAVEDLLLAQLGRPEKALWHCEAAEEQLAEAVKALGYRLERIEPASESRSAA